MSGFYTFHPVTLTEPEPTGAANRFCLAFRSASEPSLVQATSRIPGRECPGTETPSLLSLPTLTAEATTPACHVHRSSRSLPGGWRRRPEGLRRQEEPPMRQLTSRFQLPSVNRLDRPKVVIAVPRMPRLPLMSAPMSEDTTAGHEPPARHGLPEAVCVDETVTRLAAPDDPAQTALPRKGFRRTTPPTGLPCQANYPTVRRQRSLSRQTTIPFTLPFPSGPVQLFRSTANGVFGSGE